MARLNHFFGKQFLFSLILVVFCVVSPRPANGQDRAAWMKEAKWGVMNHYLADWIPRREGMRMSVEEWNNLVVHFDVEGLAKQIESVGAGYYLITIGQNSGCYLSASATYDRCVGRVRCGQVPQPSTVIQTRGDQTVIVRADQG